MVKIVVCDDVDGAFQNSGELERLDAAGTVKVYNDLAESRKSLVERLRDARIVVTLRGRTVVDRETLMGLPKLGLIASTGPHRIDIKAATELGIGMTNTPGSSTASVADHVFGLILALGRHIISTDQALRLHRWEPASGLELEYLEAHIRKGVEGLRQIGAEGVLAVPHLADVGEASAQDSRILLAEVSMDARQVRGRQHHAAEPVRQP